ncbi:SMI1/KNR4 family protein [Sinorhizobium garamanticum]|uniref:SMI1/KNR4 family protein n=1 Tax=Sinorhizobium garamanticum TaxID=680247 RepID=A0ABY8DG00_9HYPH|nr:SMI1/KNR4 family protein [Sinorhizobium garamanticum]WEX89823.1 SMI1/KNR4 family protein [Sinorhizobium garamanticum]
MTFPVSEDKIIAAETALGRRLPRELRTRLQNLNGGALVAAGDDWILHPVRDNSDQKRISRTANDVILETKAAREWRGFPADGIAIASNGTGDRLVLVPESDNVFLWNHETVTLSSVIVEWS